MNKREKKYMSLLFTSMSIIMLFLGLLNIVKIEYQAISVIVLLSLNLVSIVLDKH